MPHISSQPLVYIIAGPTASGKSALALSQALENEGEIINGDSQQLYQDLPILTAQPSLQDQRLVPHHLYGVCPLNSPCISANWWAQKAVQVIKKILEKNKIPWIVGGTGLYLKALQEGLSPIPTIPLDIRNNLYNEIKDHPIEDLRKKLREVDPPSYDRISPNDRYRIIRSLLIWEYTKSPLSFWQKQKPEPIPYFFQVFLLKIEREILKKRIKQRLQQMKSLGIIEEVQAVCQKLPQTSHIKTIGFQDIKQLLDKTPPNQPIAPLTWDTLMEKIFIKTCQYAKRQETWFRHQLHADYVIEAC